MSCHNCAHFRYGHSPVEKNLCTLTGKSALWERAVKMSAFTPNAVGHIIYTPVTDNCGPDAIFFKDR